MLELSDGNLLIGGNNNFSIQKNTFTLIDQIEVIECYNAIYIGRNIIIAESVTIRDSDGHDF